MTDEMFSEKAVVGYASTAAGFGGNALSAVSVPLEALKVSLGTPEDVANFEGAFDIELAEAVARSHAVDRLKNEIDGRSQHAAGNTAASLAGAYAGTAIMPGGGTAVGWVLGMAASIAGGAAGGMVYNYVAGSDEENTIAMTSQIRKIQHENERMRQPGEEISEKRKIPEEMVFAVLVGNLSKESLQEIDGQLTEAIKNGDKDMIKKLMADPVINSKILNSTKMDIEDMPADGNIAKKYAELINGGYLDAKYLLINNKEEFKAGLMNQETGIRIVPNMPAQDTTQEAFQDFRGLASLSHDGEQLPPLPVRPGQRIKG